MEELYKELSQKYTYCDNIAIEPFPSITPQFMQGYTIRCKALNMPIHECDPKCKNCEHRIKSQP